MLACPGAPQVHINPLGYNHLFTAGFHSVGHCFSRTNRPRPPEPLIEEMDEHISDLRQIASSLISNKANVKDIASRGLISLLRCRNANKDLAHHTEAMKDETAKGRQALERSALQLSNLIYESEYYAKEIKACRSFASSFPDDQISLQPESEFWASADEATKEKAAISAHELMLQRLTHEIQLRKAMAKDLEALKADKNHLLHSVANQEKVVKTLSANLKILDETAKPLQV